MRKTLRIFMNAIPVLLMIAFIPFVADDYILTVIFCVIIAVSFLIHREKNELVIFALGFVIMFLSELLFISTGVEVFSRNSLLGLMPLWLPFLWGYGFIAIKRSVLIL